MRIEQFMNLSTSADWILFCRDKLIKKISTKKKDFPKVTNTYT